MKAQEKAKQLFDIMSSQTYSYQPYAGAHYNVEEIGCEAGKKCSLIAVNQIIEALDNESNSFNYWIEVSKEIELL